MKYCGNCGNKVEDNVRFCPGCGAAIEAAASQPQAQQAPPATQVPPTTQAPPQGNAKAEAGDHTTEFDPKDIEANKAMGLLGYLIFFIPLIAAKESSFAKYHANQGFVLFLGFVLSSILFIIPILGWILAPILYVICGVFSVLGIINALNGKAKDLPIVGKFKIFK